MNLVVASDHGGFPLKARVIEELHKLGHSAAAMHGDMNQRARNHTLQALRRGTLHELGAASGHQSGRAHP